MRVRRARRLHPRVVVGAVLAVDACLTAPAVGQRTNVVPAPAMVTARVRVSAPGAGNHWLANIAAAPDDPKRLVICGAVGLPGSSTIRGFVFSSADKGATWQHALTDSTGVVVTEESCALGARGNAYFVTGAAHVTGVEPTDESLGNMNLYRSGDGGTTWARLQRGGWVDYTGTVIDSASSKVFIFANNVAAGGRWRGLLVPYLLTSVDSGATFRDTASAPPLPAGRVMGAYPSGVASLPDGSPIAAFGTLNREWRPGRGTDHDSATIFSVSVFIGRNGGHTLERAAVLRSDTVFLGWPAVAVDRTHGPHRGRIYVAWSEPLRPSAQRQHRGALILARSDDGGKTWTDRQITGGGIHLESGTLPRTLPKRGTLSYRDALTPTLAVNDAGVLGLAWTDEGARCTRFTLSRDGGDTFASSARLSRCGPSVRRAGYVSNYLLPLAEHDSAETSVLVRVSREASQLAQQNMVADQSGAFHPIWGEYTPSGLELWTATVWADAPAPDRVSTTSLTDVSRDVTVDIERAGYDDVGKEVWLDATLVNVGSTLVRGKVRLVLARLDMPAGPVVPIDASTGRAGADSVWDVTSVLPDEGLLPGKRSRSIPLRFRLARAPVPGTEELLTAHFHVFAQRD